MSRAVGLLGVVVLARLGFAQTNDEGLANLQFNYLNPGARSLAMAGAFTGMADDATTALANPAGLVNLLNAEASVELASTRIENEIAWAGGTVHYDEKPSGRYNYVYNYEPASFPSTVTNVSFASLVYPFQPARLVVAAFYNEQSKFERAFSTKGFVDESTSAIAFLPARSELGMSVQEAGLSAGLRAGDRLKLGGTITYSRMHIRSLTEHFGNPKFTQTLTADSGRPAFRLGALINLHERVSLGLTYARRPEYEAVSAYAEGGNLYGPEQQRFKTPDSFAVGVSFRPDPAFAFNVDVVRLFYSQLMDGYYWAYYKRGAHVPESTTRFKTTFEVEDRTELRVGTEYLRQVRGLPVAVRGGIWREPHHGMVRTTEDASISLDFADEKYDTSPFFSPRLKKDSTHVAFGAGVVFARLAVDAAFDYSRSYSRFVLSSVIYLSAR